MSQRVMTQHWAAGWSSDSHHLPGHRVSLGRLRLRVEHTQTTGCLVTAAAVPLSLSVSWTRPAPDPAPARGRQFRKSGVSPHQRRQLNGQVTYRLFFSGRDSVAPGEKVTDWPRQRLTKPRPDAHIHRQKRTRCISRYRVEDHGVLLL